MPIDERKPRYAQVGWPKEMFSTKGWQSSIKKADNARAGQNIYTLKLSAVRRACHAALCYYLLNNDGECRLAAREGLRQAHEYFFGNWRNEIPSGSYSDHPPDPAFWHRIASWSDCYIESLLWATCLDDWESVGRFSEYVTDDVNLDVEQHPENRAWLLCLAATLRNDETAASPHADYIISRPRKRERLLAAMLQGILSKDEQRANETANEYFSFYLRSEREIHLITSKIMIDGTVLINLAAHLGMPFHVSDSALPHVVAPVFKNR
jgi:hypothetical protein